MNQSVYHCNYKSCFYHALLLVCSLMGLACTPAYSQISNRLYQQLPDEYKPKDRNHLTDANLRAIVGMAHAYARKDDSTITELDKLAQLLESYTKPNDTAITNLRNISFTGEYYQFYRYDEATNPIHTRYYKKILELAPKSRNTNANVLLSNAYIALGIFQSAKKEYEAAADYFNKARLESLRANDTPTSRSGIGNLARMYLELRMFREAIAQFNLMPAHYDADEKKNGMASFMQQSVNYDKTLAFMNWYDLSGEKKYLDSAHNVLEDLRNNYQKDLYSNAYYCYLAGRELLYKGEYENAYKSFELSRKLNADTSVSVNDVYMGVALLNMGKKEEGIKLLTRALGGQEDYETATLIYDKLAAYAKSKGDWEKAYLYNELHGKYQDSLSLMVQRGKVFEVNQKYAVREKEEKISKLNAVNQAEVRRRNIILFSSIGVATILILAIVIIIKKRQVDKLKDAKELAGEKRKIEEIILQQEQKANEIREKAIREQRQLISRDMHDELSSALTALKFYVSDIRLRTNDSKEITVLKSIEEEVNGVYIQAREYMHNLQKGLEAAAADLPGFLKTLSEQYTDSGSFHIKLNVDINELEVKLNQEQQYQLDHVFKEAITNTMKHTEATEIALSIRFDDTHCHFRLTDNGGGFSPMAINGIGMNSMRVRIEALNGFFETQSSNKGTTIEGSFPLELPD